MWPFRKKTPIEVKATVQTFEPIKYTPDIPFLESVHPWLVFIYDDLQWDHPRHQKLRAAGASFPNPHRPNEPVYGYTASEFAMWKHMDGQFTFPVCLDMPPERFKNTPTFDLVGPSARHVKGQLWYMGWRGIAELDEHYRNGVEFQRRRVSILYDFYHQYETDGRFSISMRKTEYVTAWMYVGIQEVWDDVLDGTFVPVKKVQQKFHPDLPPYYWFTKLDYSVK